MIDKSTLYDRKTGPGNKAWLAIKSLSLNNEGIYYCQLTLDNEQTINISVIADAIGILRSGEPRSSYFLSDVLEIYIAMLVVPKQCFC